ncbi:MAG TPA: hypothetical protein DEA90_05995 [Opitutae bacterium]|nr:hypothetical protein [Puniceicoccaceae bacterium]HBR93699.1 hypothetical protein [Opitutae bacterium]
MLVGQAALIDRLLLALLSSAGYLSLRSLQAQSQGCIIVDSLYAKKGPSYAMPTPLTKPSTTASNAA